MCSLQEIARTIPDNREALDPNAMPIRIRIMVQIINRFVQDRLVHLSWFLFGTDAGGDMQGTRTRFFNTTGEDVFTLGMWPFCLCHQGHLMVERQLVRCGQFSVYAKRTNVRRASGNPPKLYRSIVALKDAATPKKLAGNLPPRPLKGRWVSVWSNETYWKAIGL